MKEFALKTIPLSELYALVKIISEKEKLYKDAGKEQAVIKANLQRQEIEDEIDNRLFDWGIDI